MGFVSVLPGSTRYPKVKLEWAPSATPLTTPPYLDAAWLDITSRWRGLEWSHGRNDELGSYESGRGHVLLSNADRVFDPSYTGGTWYGNLKPRRPFQFTIANSGGTYIANYVFYATGFSQAWPASGADAVTQVGLVDFMAVAEGMQFPIGYTRPQESVTDRFTAVVNDFGIPSAISASGTVVGALDVEDAGVSVLSHLRQVTESEGGGIYQSIGGDLVFASKSHQIARAQDTALRLNFTDRSNVGGTWARYSTEFQPVQDDNYLWNAATVTGVEDVVGAAANAASQAEFSPIGKTLSSLLVNPTDCEDMAQYFVWLHKQPVMRAPRITVDLASCGTSSHQNLLSASVTKSCQIRRFDNTANPLVLDQQIQGVTHSVSPGRYLMEFATSPADLTTYWTLQTSTLGTMDSTNLIAP